ncbi:MAG: amidohydrolase family protein [Chloroflexi bacterium]|nr:amidohydrolase family protein [Chloroflexota bacterium]
MRTLITGGYVVGFNGTSHEILKDGVVVFEDDSVSFVGFSYAGLVDRTIEARGKLILPGFINTHLHPRHNAGDYCRNDPGKTDYFGSNYLTYMTPRQGAKGPESLADFRIGAKFALIQAIKSGSTTIQVYGGGADGGDNFVEMVGELGFRAFVAPSFRSSNFYYEESGALRYVWDEAMGESGLVSAVAFIKKHHGKYNGRIQGMLYPRQPDTCTPALLNKTKELAKDLGVGIQIHAAMNLIEFHEILKRYGKTPIAFLHNLGFLGPEVILAHCIFLTGHSWTALPRGDDLKLIADTGTSVSHCPLEYAKLGIALETLDRYLAKGVNVSLGTDAYPLDMVNEMRIASLASRFAENDYLAGSYRDVFNAATLAGAQAVRREDIGRLCRGAKADLLIVDLRKTEIGAVFDPIKALVEYGSGRDIETVIIDGRIVVDHGHFLGVDEADLLCRVQTEADKIWGKISDWDFLGRRADEVSPWAFPLKKA